VAEHEDLGIFGDRVHPEDVEHFEDASEEAVEEGERHGGEPRRARSRRSSRVGWFLDPSGADVIGIASETNHAWLTSVGVTPVAHGDGLVERIRALSPGGVNAFIDTFGEEYVRLAIELGVERSRIDTTIAFQFALQAGVKTEGSGAAATAEVLTAMADLVASGMVTVPIAATYPLNQVRAAYAELEKRHTRGKIVLIP
jgi:NADPH:quinone reductase-like Zn-dependent oxidoreductase